MLKPDSLRRALTDAVTVLKTSPDMLRIFVDNGSIASTLATSLSFEKRYAQCHCDRLLPVILTCSSCRCWRGCGKISPTS